MHELTMLLHSAAVKVTGQWTEVVDLTLKPATGPRFRSGAFSYAFPFHALHVTSVIRAALCLRCQWNQPAVKGE